MAQHLLTPVLLKSVLAIGFGAALGALLRWQLSVQLNAFFTSIPLGTLVANLLGGYLVGLAIGYFTDIPNVSPEMQLLVITGFCGGLTTFSTFSVEVLMLIQSGRISRSRKTPLSLMNAGVKG